MLDVRSFVRQSVRLVSANTPTVPLHGDDEQLAIIVLNQLLNSYAATGLLLTIAQFYSIPLSIGQGELVVGPSTYVPVPDIPLGRLANVDSCWLELDGVTYPLIDISRDEFLASFKYNPLQGLPRFFIVYPNVETVNLRLYPAPSQYFQFNIRAKFQLSDLTSNSNLSVLPTYYTRFLLFAVAKDWCMYKGRADAWTPKLEAMLREAQDIMEAASEVNLTITGDRASLLNANWRVMSGI